MQLVSWEKTNQPNHADAAFILFYMILHTEKKQCPKHRSGWNDESFRNNGLRLRCARNNSLKESDEFELGHIISWRLGFRWIFLNILPVASLAESILRVRRFVASVCECMRMSEVK